MRYDLLHTIRLQPLHLKESYLVPFFRLLQLNMLFAVILSLFFLSSSPVLAGNYTWDGSVWNPAGFSGTISVGGDIFTVDSAGTAELAGTLTSVSGNKLTKQGTGTLRLSGDNTPLAGGLSLQEGALALGHDKALGVWLQGGDGNDNAANNQAFMNSVGMVTATGGASAIKVTEDCSTKNHFVIGVPDGGELFGPVGLTGNRTGALTFDIAAGKTLTISGVENTAQNNYIGVGGAINVNVAASSGEGALKFTGNGSLVLAANKSYRYGGAVGAYFLAVNQDFVLDFSPLSSVTFTGNIAGNDGEGYGGGIYSNAELSSEVVLGNAATFTGNIAGNSGYGEGYGGGIYSNAELLSSVKLDAGAELKDNIAGNGGEGEGGGIYSFSVSDSSEVSLLANATFTGNIAGNGGEGYGGGIYSKAELSSSVKLDAGAELKYNIAGNGGDGEGGGIYSFSDSDSSEVSLLANATFTGNIAGNFGSGYGGGIFSYSSDYSEVKLDADANLTGNIAGKVGIGAGGGIFSYSFSGSSLVNLGANAELTGNIAANDGDGYGGGIYSQSSDGSSTVKLDANAKLKNNIAANNDGEGYGGGIYSESLAGSSKVSLGEKSLLENNRACGSNKGGQGGGLYISGATAELNVLGNTFFRGNLVSQDVASGPGSLGGAVYIDDTDSAGTGIVTLNANVGAIAFSGNKVEVDTIGGVVDPASGKANSIHLARNIKLALGGDKNIYFDDPISSGIGNAKNSLTKTGTGFVQFVGDNRLNTTGFTGVNSVDITDSTLRVVNNEAAESFDASGDGVFNVDSAASLAGGGKIKAGSGGFTFSGTISPDADRFELPVYDASSGIFAAGRDTVADSKKIGKLTFEGNTTFAGATFAVDVASTSSHDLVHVVGVSSFSGTNNKVLVKPITLGTYDFLTSTNSINSAAPGTFEKITSAVNGYSLVRGSSVHLKSGDNKTLQVTLDNSKNIALSWNAANGNWSTLDTDRNWTDNPGGAAVETRFKNGDDVKFNGNGSADHSIVVATGGVAAKSMTLSGNDRWHFTEGAISVTDNVAVALDSTLGLAAGSSPSLTAKTVDFNSGKLNISGYSPSESDPYNAPNNVQTVIKTTDGILNFNPLVTVANQATTDFFSASARLADGGKNVVVETGLRWYSTDPTCQAHGTFTVDGSNSFALGAILADTATNLGTWDGKSLTQKGTGTLVLSADNSYSGGTKINDGTLKVTKVKALGTGAVVNDATLNFALSDNGTFGQVISGTGSLTKEGGGILTLSADNSYSGGTKISGGTLKVAKVKALGTGAVANDAALNFALSDNGTFGQVISGTGSLTKEGGGILTLSADNSYSGGTKITGGTLKVTTVKALGTGAVVNDAALNFALSGDYIWAKNLSGSGIVANEGSGKLIFNNDLDWNSGTVIAKAGSGGLQAGFAANKQATLNVNNFVVEKGSSYTVEAWLDSDSKTLTAPLLTAKNVTINGELKVLVNNISGLYGEAQTSAKVINAAQTLTLDNAGLEGSGTYKYASGSRALYDYAFKGDSGRNIILTISGKGTALPVLVSSLARSEASRNLALALEAGEKTLKPGGALQHWWNETINSADQATLNHFLREMNGVKLAASGNLPRQFKKRLSVWLLNNLGRLQTVSVAPSQVSAGESDESPWRIQFQTLANWSGVDGKDGEPGYDLKTFGGALAVDRLVGGIGNADLRLGLAMEVGKSKMDWDGLGDNSEADSAAWSFYGRLSGEEWFLLGGLNYGFSKVDNTRYMASQNLTADSSYTAQWYGAGLWGGYQWTAGAWELTPSAGLAYTFLRLPGYTEHGAGQANLTVDRATENNLELSGQFEVARTFVSEGGLTVRPKISVGLTTELLDHNQWSTVRFASESGVPAFRSRHSDVGRTTFDLGAGLSLGSKNVSFNLEYQGRFGKNRQDHGGQASLNFNF